MNVRKQIYVLVVLAVLLALGLFVLSYTLHTRSVANVVEVPAFIAPRPGANEKPPVREKSGEPGNSPQPDLVKDYRVSDGPYEVDVRVVSSDGSVISGLDVQWASPQSYPAREHVSTTDNNGEFRVKLKKLAVMVVRTRDAHWRLAAKIENWPKNEPAVVVAQPCGSIKIFVICEDGQPWIGKCSINEVRQGDDRFSTGCRLDGVSPQTISGVPLDAKLSFYFMQSTLWYDSQKRFLSHEQLNDGQGYVFTLTRAAKNTAGQIEVDFTSFTCKVSEASIHPAGSKIYCDTSDQNPRGLWRSRPVFPGQYVVRVKGDPPWESPPIEVKRGEITRVSFTNHLPCSVRATVLDATGKPLPRAVFSRALGYMAHNNILEVPGMTSFTGVDGSATINDVPPGTQVFVVEAKGYEPQRIETQLADGEVRELGTFYLVEATGKVTVRLKGMREKQTYSIMLLEPGGLATHFVKQTTASEIVFEHLPLRPYVVAIMAGSGGKAASASCQPTLERDDEIVEINVSALQED